MTRAVFAVPGDLASPTGGYHYARRVLDGLPGEGVEVAHLALPAGYPDPAPADLAETARLVAGTPPDAILLIDGLAYGAMPENVIAGFGRPVVALVHHPLGLESGLPPERQAALIASETRALARARRIIVTSPLTARLLAAEFDVDPAIVSVAEPGTDPAPRARGTGRPVELLAVGAVSPRKGFALLVEALGGLADRDWHLTLAGALDRDPVAAAGLRRAIAAQGFEDRVTLTGNVDRGTLDRLYAAADVLVSPSLYEGYGMALAEGLARGLPLVASTGGAAAETVPDAAALKVPPGDGPALRAALERVVNDRALRERLAEAAWAAGQGLPRWSDTAARIATVLKQAGEAA